MAKILRSRSVGFALLIAVASGQVFALDPVELTDDGGWCWFQDERAIVCGDKLVVGSVATGGDDKSRVGDVQAVVFDLLTGDKQLVELHDRLGADDHNAPAFAVLPGQRLLAIYATHGATNSFWYRVSAGGDFTQWSSFPVVIVRERAMARCGPRLRGTPSARGLRLGRPTPASPRRWRAGRSRGGVST